MDGTTGSDSLLSLAARPGAGSEPRRLRKHIGLLILRYVCVALLGLLGSVLLFVGSQTSPQAGNPYASHPADYYTAEQVTYVFLGLFFLGAAALLGWLMGPARRWLLLAGSAVCAAPVITVTHYSIVSDPYDRLANSLNEGAVCLILAGICAAILYPASRFGRQRFYHGVAWLLAWSVLVLGCLTGTAFWDYLQHRDRDGDTPLILGAILTALTAAALASCIIALLWGSSRPRLSGPQAS